MDHEAIKSLLSWQTIELPSWAFGNSGTRFKVFGQPGVPATRSRSSTTPRRCTASPASRRGSRCTSRGTWSTTTAKLAAHAADLGVQIGAINSNLFQDDDYRLGSLTHPDPAVRRKAIAHHARVRRRHAADRLDRPEAVAARRHQLPGPGRPARPAGPARRVAAEIYALLDPGSGCCSSTSSSSRTSTRRTSPTGAPRCCTAWRSASRPRSCSTPATTRPARTSSSSSCSCCGPAGSARSTSTPATTPTTT